METGPLLSMWLKGEFGLLSVALSWSADPDAIVTENLGHFHHRSGAVVAEVSDDDVSLVHEDPRAAPE